MAPPRRHEIELKATFAAADGERLHGALDALAARRHPEHPLLAVYWDTGDLALYRSGLALRVRYEGGRYVQTVKDRGERRAGLFDRREDAAPLPSARPEPDRIGDAALRRAVREARGGAALRPAARTSFRRTRRTLHQGASVVEAAVDCGEISGGDAAEPLCELELELESGHAADLYDLALSIHDRVPLRPVLVDKAERGFRLAGGETPRAVRAREASLGRHASLEDVLADALTRGLEHLLANAEALLSGDDPEAVHQLRVAARRLRSVLSALRDVLPPEAAAALRGELRRLGRELGDARDLDVFAREVLAPVVRALGDDAGLKRLAEEARGRRLEARARARAALDDPRFAALALRLGRYAAAREWRDQPLTPEAARLFAPAREHAAPLLAGRRRRVLERGAALADAAPAERHALRIALKKLRYGAETFRGVFPGERTRRYLRRAARLQDELGHWNDLATAEGILDSLLARMGEEASPAEHRAAGAVLGWWQGSSPAARTRLARRWKRFARARPFWE